MLGFVAGLLVANAGEWVMHKYVLHGLGRDRSSYWSFHWHDHHQSCRRHRFHDEAYHRSVFEPGGKAKEALGLLTAAAAVSPLAPVAPAFVAGLWASSAAYYLVHRQSHLDPEWARKWVPWHYDHHMGANQDANWCVTFPLFDYVMGTRIPYVGTERELRQREREQARRAERSAAQASGAEEGMDEMVEDAAQ
jgi:sterol desaturase/sphingolipid hydroxylase (fatty acid hydroxylase superfamily)